MSLDGNEFDRISLTRVSFERSNIDKRELKRSGRQLFTATEGAGVR